MCENDQNLAEFDRKFIFTVKFTMLTFVVVNFSVMFTNFGQIPLVILIWSSE